MSFAQFISKHCPRPQTISKLQRPKVAGVFKPGDKVRVVANPHNNPMVSLLMGKVFTVARHDDIEIYLVDQSIYVFAEEIEHV